AAGGGDDVGNPGAGPATAPNALGRGGSSATPCGAAGGGGGYFGGGSGNCDTTPPPATDLTSTAKSGGSYAGLGVAGKAGAKAVETIYNAGGGGGGGGFAAKGVSLVETSLTSGLDNGRVSLAYTSAPTTTTLASDVTTLAPGQETTINATVDGPDLTIVGDDEQADSPALAKAAAAFGAPNAAKAAAVPTKPAALGTTLTPGTACGTEPCTVTFFVNGKQLADPIDVDPATGVASVIFTAGSDQGVRVVTARYDGNLYYLQSASGPLSITVAGLANTGPSNVAPMLVSSVVLLAAGAGLVAFGRRRPQVGGHRAA
ncbi:hypothetical protein ACXR2U_22630, partial [Jatrophihabitans sp. YIM 134969]